MPEYWSEKVPLAPSCAYGEIWLLLGFMDVILIAAILRIGGVL